MRVVAAIRGIFMPGFVDCANDVRLNNYQYLLLRFPMSKMIKQLLLASFLVGAVVAPVQVASVNAGTLALIKKTFCIGGGIGMGLVTLASFNITKSCVQECYHDSKNEKHAKSFGGAGFNRGTAKISGVTAGFSVFSGFTSGVLSGLLLYLGLTK